jgi:outer membrane protein assembly factor BamB
LEFNKIKEHASDLQTFLSLPHLISKTNDEEKNVERFGSEGKLNRKSIIFTARTDEIIKMKSIGDVGVDDIKSDVAYVKEKEKQAQIVGPLTRRTNDRINLKLLKEIDVKVGNRSNIITGCTILDNGKVLFSEYNSNEYIDRVTLNDSNGNFIRTVQELESTEESFYDITSIDTNTIALSMGSYISIVNIDTQNMLHKIENKHHCYGIAHCDGKLYYYHEKEGIRQFDMKTKANQLLVSTFIDAFSHICCDGNKLLYISDTEAVSCCDMNGKQMWSFNDTSLLHVPRGIVVDSDGFVFVTGKKTGNIVVISPDGNSAKEVYQISVPRAMCYDIKENKILVCHTGRKASWFQISVDV